MRCCDFMIGGTCRRQSEQLRVTVQLTNVGDGHLLWADQFDMLASVDNFVQEDAVVAQICAAVSQSLQPASLINDRQRARKRPGPVGHLCRMTIDQPQRTDSIRQSPD
jgi:hypothetical protein